MKNLHFCVPFAEIFHTVDYEAHNVTFREINFMFKAVLDIIVVNVTMSIRVAVFYEY